MRRAPSAEGFRTNLVRDECLRGNTRAVRKADIGRRRGNAPLGNASAPCYIHGSAKARSDPNVGVCGVVLFVGYGLRKLIPPLARYNLPAPVLGGLLVAVIALIARERGVTLAQFDTTLQTPLMIAFFTTIGFGASVSLLKHGRPAGAAVFRASRPCSRCCKT